MRVLDDDDAIVGDQPAVARGLCGEVAFFRAYQAFWANDVPAQLSNSQQALDSIPLDWWHARVIARLILAIAHHMVGDPAGAAAALATGATEAQADGPYLMRSQGN